MQIADLIGSAEAAVLLGVDRKTFNKWVAAGRISPQHALPGVTGARLFARADVEALVAEREQASA